MHHKKQVEEVIHREVAYILKRYIDDPRLKSITVTKVSLTKKLDYADIKVTQLNTSYSHYQTLEGLEKAASKIRYHLAQHTQARRAPQLRFHYDSSLESSMHLSQLINEAVGLHSNA